MHAVTDADGTAAKGAARWWRTWPASTCHASWSARWDAGAPDQRDLPGAPASRDRGHGPLPRASHPGPGRGPGRGVARGAARAQLGGGRFLLGPARPGVRFEGFEAGVADQVTRLLEVGRKAGLSGMGARCARRGRVLGATAAVRETGSLRVKLGGAAFPPLRDGPLLAAGPARRALAGCRGRLEAHQNEPRRAAAATGAFGQPNVRGAAPAGVVQRRDGSARSRAATGMSLRVASRATCTLTCQKCDVNAARRDPAHRPRGAGPPWLPRRQAGLCGVACTSTACASGAAVSRAAPGCRDG